MDFLLGEQVKTMTHNEFVREVLLQIFAVSIASAPRDLQQKAIENMESAAQWHNEITIIEKVSEP